MANFEMSTVVGARTNEASPDKVPEQNLGAKGFTTKGEMGIYGKAGENIKTGDKLIVEDKGLFKKYTGSDGKETAIAIYPIAEEYYGWAKVKTAN